MTIETIDGVQYYVWRVGDELPKYQPVGCEIRGGMYNGYKTEILPKIWDGLYDMVIWPKLLDDRAQHQRMIDEAFEKMVYKLSHDGISYHDIEVKTLIKQGKYEHALDHLAKAGAYVKRMMEYVQSEIDKRNDV